MKISIELQRTIARLCLQGQHSGRAIARSTGASRGTVATVRRHLQHKNLTWLQLQELDDAAFAQLLGSGSTSNRPRKAVPDWHHVDQELRRPNVTQELVWNEFRQENPDGVSYSQFTRLYRQWCGKKHLSMRQIYKAGETMFVDFCGHTPLIIDPETGESQKAQVFVGVLGSSGYIFAYAVASQKIQDWQTCQIKAFEHFGGVPKQVVPDNLKSAVRKHTAAEVVLNRSYAELAEFYDFAVMPARPRRPRDKGLGEVSVQVVQRGVLAWLRDRTFFSLAELNDAMSVEVDRINRSTSRKAPVSRWDRFQELDKPALSPLPANVFAPCEWRYGVCISSQYLFEHSRHFYSVPWHFANQKVDLRIANGAVEAWHQRRCLARHDINTVVGGMTRLEKHMPGHHRFQQESSLDALMQWAHQVGEHTTAFAQRNLGERKDLANGMKTVAKLRAMVREEEIPHHRLESICAYALKLGAFTFDRLKSIYRHNLDLKKTEPVKVASSREHENVRGKGYYAGTASGVQETAGAPAC